MKLYKFSIGFLFSVVLSACGGGGNSGSEAATPPVINPPVVVPPVVVPPVVVIPPPYTLTPSTLSAIHVAGYPATVTINAKQTVTFAGVVYIKAVSDSAVIDPDIVVTPLADATVDVQVKTSSTAKPGHYTGNISINICTDILCANHLAGSPFKLPYEIDVVSPDGGVTAINLSELSPVAGAPDWETFQGNAQHTAYVPVTLTPSAFNARWKWFAPAVEGRQSQPSTLVTGGGMIFLSTGKWYSPTGASFVTAYSEKDGSKVWSHSFNDLNFPMAQPPAFSNGNVYVSAGGQESTAMFGFDATTGRQLFKSKMSAQWPSYLAPTIFNGSIYTNGGSYGGLYSFSPVMGALNFFTQLEQYDGWTPALDAKNLYAYMNGSLKLIDPATGVLRGEIIDPTYSWNGYTNSAAPVIGANGLVLSVNLTSQKKNGIVAFDVLKKNLRWSTPGSYPGNPAYADGVIFAANNETLMLEARKEADGTLIWSWTAPSDARSFNSDVLVTNNLIFVSTATTTYAIDRTTHASVWSYKASGKLAMSANGILYIKGDTTIVAINLK